MLLGLIKTYRFMYVVWYEGLKVILNMPFLQVIPVLGDPEVTANLYCNFADLYWKGYVICSIYLR